MTGLDRKYIEKWCR